MKENNINSKIFQYLLHLNTKNIKIKNENYFLSQKKYEKIPIIGREVARVLYFFSFLLQPEKILEIGFGSGYSAEAIYEGLNQFTLNKKNFKFISLERERKRFKRGKNYIKAKNYRIELLNIDFFDYLKIIEKNKDLRFDFVFVDGVKKRYFDIFKNIKPYIKRGGIIIFDNILFSGRVVELNKNEVEKYIKGSLLLNNFNHFAASDKDFVFIFLKIDDGLAIGIKK